jgi:hypothetical protein
VYEFWTIDYGDPPYGNAGANIHSYPACNPSPYHHTHPSDVHPYSSDVHTYSPDVHSRAAHSDTIGDSYAGLFAVAGGYSAAV